MDSTMSSPAGRCSIGTGMHPPTASVAAAHAAENEAAGKQGLEAVQTVTAPKSHSGIPIIWANSWHTEEAKAGSLSEMMVHGMEYRGIAWQQITWAASTAVMDSTMAGKLSPIHGSVKISTAGMPSISAKSSSSTSLSNISDPSRRVARRVIPKFSLDLRLERQWPPLSPSTSPGNGDR